MPRLTGLCSCGIFVYRLATSKETRKASSGRFYEVNKVSCVLKIGLLCHYRSANRSWLMNLCESVEDRFSGWVRCL